MFVFILKRESNGTLERHSTLKFVFSLSLYLTNLSRFQFDLLASKATTKTNQKTMAMNRLFARMESLINSDGVIDEGIPCKSDILDLRECRKGEDKGVGYYVCVIDAKE